MGYAIAFFSGGAYYLLCELLWRGHTHPAMFLAGGTCTLLLYGLYIKYSPPLAAMFALCALIISAVEFIFGYVCNVRMKRNIWDYSRVRFNLYGQVCLPFSLLWGAFCLPVCALSRHITAML